MTISLTLQGEAAAILARAQARAQALNTLGHAIGREVRAGGER